ncbi:Uncharacterised protein [Mycobacterium tuberculosis]|nr:Uncharacterised protein [Mycobacterium tuberculosis]
MWQASTVSANAGAFASEASGSTWNWLPIRSFNWCSLAATCARTTPAKLHSSVIASAV